MLCRYNVHAPAEIEELTYFAFVTAITDGRNAESYIEGPSSKNDLMSPLPQGKRVFFWTGTQGPSLSSTFPKRMDLARYRQRLAGFFCNAILATACCVFVGTTSSYRHSHVPYACFRMP